MTGAAARRRAVSGRQLTAALLATVHAMSLGGAALLVVVDAGADPLRPILIVFLGCFSVAAVRWPGSAAGLVAIVATVVSYVVTSTISIALDAFDSPSSNRVLLLAACLYLAHSTDALRGFAPGADLDRSVQLRWLRRIGEALIPGTVIGAVVMWLPASDGANPLWLLGAVAVIAAAAVPALRVQRRPWRKPAAVRDRDEQGDPSTGRGG